MPALEIPRDYLAEIDAQSERRLSVGGQMHDRVRYGEGNLNVLARCPDCACAIAQFHVFPCLQERCPRCKTGQAAGCRCTLQ